MKRKVIQLAGKTFVVSLPRKWVVKYGINKGEELDVEPKNGSIVIGTERTTQLEKQILDVSNMNERVIRWALSALNKSGVDEIEIINYTPEALKIMQELVKDLFMGFAIMEQTPKRCVLRNVSKELETEFDAMLRRAFLVTLSMGESTLEYIKQGKMSSMKELIALEHTNNQLTNFCERILNKQGYKDYRKTCFLYVIAWNLEKVCDDYKYICDYLSKPENSKTKISKEVLDFFERANRFLRSYYELFYNFDVKKLVELSEEKNILVEEAKKFLVTKKDKEVFIINTLINMIIKTKDFSASSFALNSN